MASPIADGEYHRLAVINILVMKVANVDVVLASCLTVQWTLWSSA